MVRGISETGDFSGQFWRFDEVAVAIAYGGIGMSDSG
jgi:hypothetical protein